MAVKRFIDIGANLTDPMYNGIYHGSKKHEPDLKDVLERARENGVDKIIITGGSVEDSKQALELARSHPYLYSTVGCHPTRCDEFNTSNDPNAYLDSLSQLIKDGGSKIVALGEFGLDYERLQFCNKDVQLKYFEKQLCLSTKYNLPLFLHCRAAADDLISILSRHKDLPGGVVHSFDGTIEDAHKIIDLGFFIGINGCSLKTKENISVVKNLPVDRLMLETDAPWCEVRPSHAGFEYIKTTFPSVKKEKWQKGFMIKSRNEPTNIIQVLEIVANIKGTDPNLLADTIYKNTKEIFFHES
jgi:TatD DNase family protein